MALDRGCMDVVTVLGRCGFCFWRGVDNGTLSSEFRALGDGVWSLQMMALVVAI